MFMSSPLLIPNLAKMEFLSISTRTWLLGILTMTARISMHSSTLCWRTCMTSFHSMDCFLIRTNLLERSMESSLMLAKPLLRKSSINSWLLKKMMYQRSNTGTIKEMRVRNGTWVASVTMKAPLAYLSLQDTINLIKILSHKMLHTPIVKLTTISTVCTVILWQVPSRKAWNRTLLMRELCWCPEVLSLEPKLDMQSLWLTKTNKQWTCQFQASLTWICSESNTQEQMSVELWHLLKMFSPWTSVLNGSNSLNSIHWPDITTTVLPLMVSWPTGLSHTTLKVLTSQWQEKLSTPDTLTSDKCTPACTWQLEMEVLAGSLYSSTTQMKKFFLILQMNLLWSLVPLKSPPSTQLGNSIHLTFLWECGSTWPLVAKLSWIWIKQAG